MENNGAIESYSALYDGKGLFIKEINLGNNIGGGTSIDGGKPILPKSDITIEELLSLVNGSARKDGVKLS